MMSQLAAPVILAIMSQGLVMAVDLKLSSFSTEVPYSWEHMEWIQFREFAGWGRYLATLEVAGFLLAYLIVNKFFN